MTGVRYTLVIEQLMQTIASFAWRFYPCGFAKGCGGCTIFLCTVKVAYGCPHEMNVPNVMLVKRSARIVHETMQAFMTAVNANVQEDVENEVAATKGENVSGVKIMVTLGKRQQNVSVGTPIMIDEHDVRERVRLEQEQRERESLSRCKEKEKGLRSKEREKGLRSKERETYLRSSKDKER
ncbi:uncharacterized protein LOC110706058 [Chenopodium quinoa]|uniref:Uncharacterized protein n=1 Tax=Chenopodium quinoa TaxID=63459 RepID=A0A803MVR7_CHEQI|nr:uncharacterized protein LOC110706058 [Chenopodium quinoa]